MGAENSIRALKYEYPTPNWVFRETGSKKASTNSEVLSSAFSKPSVTFFVLTGNRKRIFAFTAQACVAKQSKKTASILFFSADFIKPLMFSCLVLTSKYDILTLYTSSSVLFYNKARVSTNSQTMSGLVYYCKFLRMSAALQKQQQNNLHE